MKLAVLPIMLFGILLNAGAQIALKAGVTRIDGVSWSWSNLIPLIWQLASNPLLWLGLSFYVVSVVIWVYVLSRVDVSVAYPLVSLGYIINAFAAYYLLHENITLMRIAGTIIILIGVFIVARS